MSIRSSGQYPRKDESKEGTNIMKPKTPDVPGLSTRLRQAREASGLSQSQAARLLGMHRPTVSNIEAGERKVSAGELKEFAEVYKVSTEWLLDEAMESNSQIKLAARKLSGLRDKDLETVMRIVDSLRRNKE
jgi:transcriptional regulator with XRE-family HTH domain